MPRLRLRFNSPKRQHAQHSVTPSTFRYGRSPERGRQLHSPSQFQRNIIKRYRRVRPRPTANTDNMAEDRNKMDYERGDGEGEFPGYLASKDPRSELYVPGRQPKGKEKAEVLIAPMPVIRADGLLHQAITITDGVYFILQGKGKRLERNPGHEKNKLENPITGLRIDIGRIGYAVSSWARLVKVAINSEKFLNQGVFKSTKFTYEQMMEQVSKVLERIGEMPDGYVSSFREFIEKLQPVHEQVVFLRNLLKSIMDEGNELDPSKEDAITEDAATEEASKEEDISKKETDVNEETAVKEEDADAEEDISQMEAPVPVDIALFKKPTTPEPESKPQPKPKSETETEPSQTKPSSPKIIIETGFGPLHSIYSAPSPLSNFPILAPSIFRPAFDVSTSSTDTDTTTTGSSHADDPATSDPFYRPPTPRPATCPIWKHNLRAKGLVNLYAGPAEIAAITRAYQGVNGIEIRLQGLIAQCEELYDQAGDAAAHVIEWENLVADHEQMRELQMRSGGPQIISGSVNSMESVESMARQDEEWTSGAVNLSEA